MKQRQARNRSIGRWIASFAIVATALVLGADPRAEGTGSAIEPPSLSADSARPADSLAEPPVAEAGLGPGWDLPHIANPRVDYWVARFDTVPAMRKKFQRFLDRGGEWVPVILAKLDERGMPRDLVYLAMIESGFNPAATSSAKAAGIWQFVRETGERYGLAVDRAVDERRDPVRATDAALDYLQELHDRFGSWYLAAAAYNTGENRIGRIMREAFGRERARSESDYYRIWDRLPSETRDYVPLMIAAARITKHAEDFGFRPVQASEPRWEHLTVPPATPLIQIAHSVGSTVAEIRALNPQFRIGRTPNDRSYSVRVPLRADVRSVALVDD